MPKPQTAVRRHLPNSPFAQSRAAEQAAYLAVEVGDRVSHERHGLGRAVKLDGDRAVIVDFAGDLRRVALNSPRLERL